MESTTRGGRIPARRLAAAAWLAVCVTMAPPGLARAQTAAPPTPAAMYTLAQEQEQLARTAKPLAAAAMRAAAIAYERLFRAFPASGYADNAVWQAAHLWRSAYEQSGHLTDLQQAARWFTWLRKEYPASPFAPRVAAALTALSHQAPASARPAPARPAPTPPTTPARTTAPPPATASRPPDRTALPAGPAVVRSITSTPIARGQRIAIEFSRQVRYSGSRVAGPDRLFFDFPDTMLPAAVIEKAASLIGPVIQNVRFGQPAADTTRVVLDLDHAPRYAAVAEQSPFRVVIDVVSDTLPVPAPAAPPVMAPSTARAAATPPTKAGTDTTKPADPPPTPAAPGNNGAYSLGRQLGLGVSRIVIDAGHGGRDPGATAHGLSESELVLDVAKRLQALLVADGSFEVVLTRDADEYVPLERRTAIANRERADLFLSIHANASPDNEARGVETYFLNLATNAAAEAVAARENASSAHTMGTLPQLVKAITNNSKIQESRELATFVQTSLVNGLSAQNRALRDLGVKQAPFVVLIGAEMPSVLAEISFLTNRAEATLLKQPGFRQRIAQALFDGIVKYQASLKHGRATATRDGGE